MAPVIVQTIANRWSKRSRASSPLADTFNLPALPSSAAGKALLWHAVELGPHDGPSREALRSYDAIAKSFELVAIEPNGPGTIALFVDGREIATVEPGRTAGVLYSYAQDLPADDWVERQYSRIWFRVCVGRPWAHDIFLSPCDRAFERLRDMP